MDAGLAWTIVGSVAGVAAVASGAVFGVLQLRQGRKNAGDPTFIDRPTGSSQDMAGGVLPPPLGRLPKVIRGRSDLVAELMGLAESPDGMVHVLAGLGGCGKTTVALAVMGRIQSAGRRVWWVPAVDPASVTRLLLGLAQRLGASDSELQEALAGRVNPSDVLWQWLELAKDWMLVLDNADDVSALITGDRSPADGAGWLRPTHAGMVVVTSRTGDPDVWGRFATVHPVVSLDADEGARVLTDLAPGAGDEVTARVLAVRLGGLPLALHQAGTYLRSAFAAERTFTRYGQALAERFGELLGRGDDDRGRVIGTWELSLEALTVQGLGQARMLLQVLSCFAYEVAVPTLLLDDSVLAGYCGGSAAVEDGLAGLLAVGLIETRAPAAEGDRLSVMVHPLVAETIRYQAADSLTESFAVAVDLIVGATGRLSSEDPDDTARWLALLPHLRAMVELKRSAPAEVLARLAQSAVRMSRALLWGGSYLASLEIAEIALDRATGIGQDHDQILALRFRQASAQLFLGRVAEAETGFRQLLEMQLRVGGPDHQQTLLTRYEIARLLTQQGKTAEAETGLQEVLDAQLRVLGPDDPETLSTRHDLATILSRQGKTVEAEAGYRQLLDAQQRILGSDHPDSLHTVRMIRQLQQQEN